MPITRYSLTASNFTDVTIIESEIEIEFLLKNRIESKSIFGWYL